MKKLNRGTVVGVFHSHDDARSAIRALKDAGFREDQIGVAGRHADAVEGKTADETYAGEGALAGAATGAGLGALWGLGIAAGVMPVIGPAIAGGTLAAILTSAAAGAAAAGLGGALIGMGISKEEAEYYESEMHAGRTIVTVAADGRADEAQALLRRYNGYDSTTRPTVGTTGTSVDVPVSHRDVVGDRPVTGADVAGTPRRDVDVP